MSDVDDLFELLVLSSSTIPNLWLIILVGREERGRWGREYTLLDAVCDKVAVGFGPADSVIVLFEIGGESRGVWRDVRIRVLCSLAVEYRGSKPARTTMNCIYEDG